MSDEQFRLVLNEHGQWDIYDNKESKEKTEEKGYPCICIYNDLGNVHFSSAPQLCELLNELSTENRQVIQKNKELLLESQGSYVRLVCFVQRLGLEGDDLARFEEEIGVNDE